MIGRYYSTYAGISISFFRENSSPMHFPHNLKKKNSQMITQIYYYLISAQAA
jgi:hypothetical protein